MGARQSSSSAYHPVGRERILDTAEALFARRGYRAVSVRDIAAACGVTNAALYYYFPSKGALFREVWLRRMHRLGQAIRQAATPPGKPYRRLQAALWAYARAVAACDSVFFWRNQAGALRELAPQDRRALMREAQQAVLAPLEDLLQEAATAGLLQLPEAPFSAAGALLGLFHGLLQPLRVAQPPDETLLRRAVEQAVRMFWQALQPPAGGEP